MIDPGMMPYTWYLEQKIAGSAMHDDEHERRRDSNKNQKSIDSEWDATTLIRHMKS